ncbi:MAG: C5a peptidase precursor, partial [Bacteroidota bacterium]
MKKQLISLALVLLALPLFAQQDRSVIIRNTNVAVLDSLADAWGKQAREAKSRALAAAAANGWPVRSELPDGQVMELMSLDDQGNPVYYTTNNAIAAISARTNKVHSGGGLGLNLNGAGMTLGEWDDGAVRLSHEQLAGRVTQVDGAVNISNHATHVAGTLIGDGTGSNPTALFAKGMAPQALLNAYDWNLDLSEMATAAAAGLLVSNHSYGVNRGWQYTGNSGGYNSWTWYGGCSQFNPIGEDADFGKYNEESWLCDLLAYSAPYYLVVKAAGNDRGENPSTSDKVRCEGGGYVDYNTAIHPLGDGFSNWGFDKLEGMSVSKNTLTVAAVEDVLNYTGPGSVVMSSFSSWGGTDDGRIKPDISGNGVGVYSSLGGADDAYASYNGTSMASPSVAGSAILLQEHYDDTHDQNLMRAATLKGLIIHTADEAGDHPGPDYRFGWGLMNTEKAVQVISQDVSQALTIQEKVLVNNGSFSMPITSNGLQPLAITLSWTDPPATPDYSATVDNPDIKLVNDLDLRLVSSDTTVYFPYVLDPAYPAAAASTGDNIRDNVEKIYLGLIPAGSYTLSVSHKGSLSGNSQAFSLIVTGAELPGGITGNPTACGINLNIPDNSCSLGNKFLVKVASAPGNTMGTNVFLKEVKLIVEHTYAADLTMKLHSPNGVVVELTSGNGGSGDNYGDPGDTSCQNATRFAMWAPTSITAASAPFLGTYKPEGDFYNFLDGSNPVGFWVLEICDVSAVDVGKLKFAELVFS